jgi:hypothetical protein
MDYIIAYLGDELKFTFGLKRPGAEDYKGFTTITYKVGSLGLEKMLGTEVKSNTLIPLTTWRADSADFPVNFTREMQYSD